MLETIKPIKIENEAMKIYKYNFDINEPEKINEENRIDMYDMIMMALYMEGRKNV